MGGRAITRQVTRADGNSAPRAVDTDGVTCPTEQHMDFCAVGGQTSTDTEFAYGQHEYRRDPTCAQPRPQRHLP